MIYVIDTFRQPGWKAAFPSAVIIAIADYDIQLTSDDHVYAHLTEFKEYLSQDVFDGTHPTARRIKVFRENLINAAKNGSAPLLIVYSGDPISKPEAGVIREKIRQTSLPGYPDAQIEVYPRAISPLVEAPGIQALVGSVISIATRKKCDAPNPITERKGLEGSDNGGEYLDTIALMCDAWLLNQQQVSEGATNLPFTAPTSAIDWFRVFGKAPSNESVKTVAEKTGEARVATELLLDAVLWNRNMPLAIDRFLTHVRHTPCEG